jgi:hypothetical protein
MPLGDENKPNSVGKAPGKWEQDGREHILWRFYPNNFPTSHFVLFFPDIPGILLRLTIQNAMDEIR